MAIVFARTALSLSLAALVATPVSAALVAAPALAGPDARTVTVRTADLDLATSAGQRTLHGRILHAVATVSGEVDPRDLTAMAAHAATRRTALTSAAARVRVAIANAHGGKAYAANDPNVVPAS